MRMARTETFKRWAHIEARRAAGKMQEIDESVERAMRPGNLKLEVKDDNGRWIDAPLDMTLPDTTVEAENGTIIAEHAAYVAGPRPRKIR